MMYPLFIIICSIIFQGISSKILKNNVDLCNNLVCDETIPVCGLRIEGKGFVLKLYDNECKMLKERCGHDSHKLDYGVIDLKYCDKAFKTKTNYRKSNIDKCRITDCPYPNEKSITCGIREDGDGFRLHQFESQCQLWLHNCKYNVKFVEDDAYLCDGLQKESIEVIQEIVTDEIPVVTSTSTEVLKKEITTLKNKKDKPIVVIVDNMLTFKQKNITRTINDFFETTHIFDLPLQEVNEHTAGSGRRMWIKNAGPVKIFKPWVIVPKNISDDFYHRPTLSTCYHKCPMKCPNTYAPVCGVPGTIAREPSLMFQNHCFMDVAQCKMRWEDKSETAASSGYKEASFLFCLGDELYSVYRFLPLIRTLQHMGRLKKKGFYREKITNMKFLNNIISKQPNLMG